MTPEQAPERLITERERDHSLGLQYWLIFLRDTEEFAGCAGLRPWSKDPLIIEVGVNLMRAAWGQRLGEEAILAALAHVFNTLKLPVVVSGHGIDHDNSRKLLERVGFTYTHNILWGPKEIEVCMWGDHCRELERQASVTTDVRTLSGLARVGSRELRCTLSGQF